MGTWGQAVVRRAPCAVVYVAPQLLPMALLASSLDELGVETIRLIMIVVVAVAAFTRSLDAGPYFLAHGLLHLLAMSTAVLPPPAAWLLLFIRAILFHEVVAIARWPRKSYTARFNTTTAKLEAFFRLHDPARLKEARALVREYFGNETLLFAKLDDTYMRATPVVVAAVPRG
ncbi:hypothetical protein SDRG_00421 [Saprolegnia diclina VS20]|uniref:Uncharacterized protein n=1 Tax=Saprolegnia diclina (strain VS20) TaxID=1156394 RepID=T0QWS7_SAPDV|nr:hypothetical protein SDRG_00421 [Saprolegnia diclina VS20]EQC42694.1 hypothetical protein SDRG_00421 [Saprolegnia diclina VS20]|eukprot:XP_008604117.1 hypothetical protein SDRG_00421 [Saprolegnia diclina VS20]